MFMFRGGIALKIGQRIKELRHKIGLSVEELAQKVGKNKATIYRYESNEIEDLPTGVLIPLAKALHTSPSYLIGWEDNKIQSNNVATNNTVINSNFAIGHANTTLSDIKDEHIIELIKIFNSLPIKGQTILLSYAYELEQKFAQK